MADREEILNAVRFHAAQNGGKALGRERFEQATGIRESAWHGRYWARWGDLVQEAGFEAGKWQTQRLTADELIRVLADFTLELGRYPAKGDRNMRHRQDPAFPMEKTFWDRLGPRAEQVRLLMRLAVSEPKYAAVYDLVSPLAEAEPAAPGDAEALHGSVPGRVYLLRSGSRYKIGKTDQPDRRYRDLQTISPEPLVEVHVLETDDPSGIELYWHRRFEAKRVRGEWFDLTDSDVAAFQRRGSFM